MPYRYRIEGGRVSLADLTPQALGRLLESAWLFKTREAKDGVGVHCGPIRRGQEIADEVADGPNS